MTIGELVKDYQVLISSAAAICSTFYIVRNNRRIAAQKNAVEIVRAINQDPLMQDGLKLIRKHHEASDHDIAILAEMDLDDEKREEKKKVLYVLNQYEHLAVGIKHKTYDEKIVKQSSYGTIVNLEKECRSLIERARSISKRDTIWCNIQSLAQRWDKKPLKINK